MILDDIMQAIASKEEKPNVINISKDGYEELLRDERSLNQPYFGSGERPQLSIFGVIVKVNENQDKLYELSY
ncbi:hypothetical protein [Acinetobacter sp. TAC-1]|uniref:hypothetical protein n=1 Tax=Acinetobacter sp. TAC-1 TaxID=3027470 RepID=UPI0023AB0E1E|nr:hypothetical protein [Acinetobacter sp. TAC-1]WEE40989.1 hypothetical protein PYV58_07475 [Acinetobacter sp. TAC-1]